MRITCIAAIAAGLAPTALGANVLVLSSTSQSIDNAAVAALEAGGHSTAIGPSFTDLAGSQVLAGYDVVYLQANYNWGHGDMPVGGQQAILNFVAEGGGLITSEWSAYEVAADKFQQIGAAFPVIYHGASGDAATTFTEAVADPVLSEGLPDSFEFPLNYFAGTEGILGAKCGATVYYESAAAPGAGATGWNYGVGRVLSFSTLNGATQTAAPDFAVLLSNAASWAAQGGGDPDVNYNADCDGSGGLDLFDFLCYTNSFNVHELYADCTGEGSWDLFDFLCFVNAFNAGC